MSNLEKIEQIRMRGLIIVFCCSILLSFSFIIRILYSWNHAFRSFPYENEFAISDMALIALISTITLWKHLRLRKLNKTGPSARIASNDERVRFNWLKAYRVAFFTVLFIQVASKGPIMIWGAPWDVPFQSQLSLSAAITTVLGAFVFYNRKDRHE
ncbi:MAG: hypothetical protein E4H21_08580 [Thermodesulfobacteriales bacterium]|nr:MAG: hypothetical protein E4H21_08580 [Thermodesulfobacteriales bacterium]